jgi:hypothetical protein
VSRFDCGPLAEKERREWPFSRQHIDVLRHCHRTVEGGRPQDEVPGTTSYSLRLPRAGVMTLAPSGDMVQSFRRHLGTAIGREAQVRRATTYMAALFDDIQLQGWHDHSQILYSDAWSEVGHEVKAMPAYPSPAPSSHRPYHAELDPPVPVVSTGRVQQD